MTPANLAGQFGDTTYTKVFVGGLAWETQRETMKKYFEQFGEILEAVVITDKNTGRSKGYGFVTFREPESAMKACVDPAPVIDGRRANCNLASLGVQRSKPSTPKHGGGRNFRATNFFPTGLQSGVGTAFPSSASFPHYAVQQGIPYNVYGYSPYSPDYTFPTNYYNVFGGAAAAAAGQYPMYGGGSYTGTAAFYPYFQLGHVLCPQFHTISTPLWRDNVYATPNTCSVCSSTTGMTMALPAPALHAPTPQHYRLISSPFTPSAPEQSSA
ncbi:hypothetical protein AAC387_Pa04g2485 [Persea americana]